MNPSELEKFAENLKDFTQEQLYRQALKAQMEINWDFAREYVQKCQPFTFATSVMDLGCGPGDFLVKLAHQFPDKVYSGYDMSEAFIEIAKKLAVHQKLNINFASLDLMTGKWPKADFIILRNVLQHIKNLDAFIVQMDSSVTSGSYVLINDAADDNVYCMSEPPIQQWQLVLENLAEKQKAAGGNRNAVSDFLYKLPTSWQVLDDQIVSLKIGKESRFAFAQYVLSGANLLPRFFGMDVNCEKLKEEVLAWFDNQNSSASFKFRWLLLKNNS